MDRINILKKIYLIELGAIKEMSRKKEKELLDDNRTDEANFEKIKVNIIEIFTTLFHAEERKLNKTEHADETEHADRNEQADKDRYEYDLFCRNYLLTFDRIPAAWKKKLEYADMHALVEEKAVEEIKLETAGMIKELFIKNMKGADIL